MYRALYRKYRPSDFSGVCGQPQVVRTLKNQITEGRLSHAYLFTGSRGTGKTSCAKILAKAVNCLATDKGNPCNNCAVCKGIDDESILDIIEIDAASNNGVDDIRELRAASAFTPATAKYRVYIIDEVHMLSVSAFNALLKTLEEPPEHVIFILATTEVHKLPATILSRCQRFDFRRISPDDIADRLQYVAGEEGFKLTRDAALLIGKLSDGAMRDALSLLDVCSSAGDVDEQTVLDCAGMSGRQYLYELLNYAFSGDTAATLDLIDRLYAGAKDLGRLCDELVGYLRDMMLIKSVRDPQKLLRCPQSEMEQLTELSAKVRLDTVLHAMELMESTAADMRAGAARRTAVETAFIKLCDPSLDSSTAALLRRVTALECGTPRVQTAPPQVAEKPAEAPKKAEVKAEVKSVIERVAEVEKTAEVKAEKPASKEEIVTESVVPPMPANDSGEPIPFDRWNDVLAAVGKTDPMMKAALSDSEAFVQGEYMLIKIAHESFKDMVNKDARHRGNLKAAIAFVTGQPYKIGPYKEPERSVTSAIADDPLDKLILSAKEAGLPTSEE
ncbi:MAG: DNA polymerase III subunit gamma/tau [Clostridia bacterium]|nr:DNA polymerase III subunit gamma/tau [Clostridia bacterium]